MEIKKIIDNRFLQIIFSTLKSLSPALVNVILSIIVIRYYSEDLWGKYSEQLLLINLLLMFASWSNKEYLLREFSIKPAQLKTIFWNVFFTRALFILPIILSVLIYSTESEVVVPATLLLLLKFLNNSFDPLYSYYKKFLPAFIIDLITSFISLLLIYYFYLKLNLMWLCWIIAIIEFIKIIWYSFVFKKEILFPTKISVDFNYFLRATPIFIIGIISFMQSKIDQFMVNYFLSDSEKAIYQVVTNLLLLLMAIPSYLTVPFMKNIYRMNNNALNKVAKKIIVLGCIISPIGVLCLSVVLSYVYRINLRTIDFILSVLYVLPVFYYSFKFYLIYKIHNDMKVTSIILAGFILNTVAGFFLIPNYGISGGLCSATIGQWGIMILLYLSELKRK